MSLFIYRGYYSENNLSSSELLSLQPPGFVPTCANYNFTRFDFEPMSSNVTAYGGFAGPSGNISLSLVASTSISGYYSQLQSQPNVFPQTTSFPKGSYTVVAADEWGQLVVLHFDVN
jgi:hypothetical protein